ncbi:MAG: ABC transporter permease [Thermoleophilia bacterium]|nr:ABC transporter permease [Thermoleophilia bacterium]
MRLFLHQLRADQLVFWRNRESAIFVYLFPVLLFLLLGTVYGGTYEGRPVVDYLVASLIAYGVANTAFGGLAIMLVVRRELGILKRIRSTPLPAATYVAAALASIVVVFLLQTATILLLGKLVYDAAWPDDWLSVALAVGVGAAAFCALGLAAAALIRSSEGAAAVVNVIILPMTFLSGGFGPTRDFPDFLQRIADVLPLTYFVELIVGIFVHGEALWAKPGTIAVLVLWGLIGAAIAVRRFRWEPRLG